MRSILSIRALFPMVAAAGMIVAIAAEVPRRNQSVLPKIRIAPDGRSFTTSEGKPFVPFGVTYYRPGTGWAPQVWKQWDAAATRQDFARMKEAGVNCARVFLSYGSFCTEDGALDAAGLAKFDEFLAIAEESGVYVHPTGLDHWEGTPRWARDDRVADEKVLRVLEDFWKAFAARYRGRNVIFSYDLRNEPEVSWYNGVMRVKWGEWVARRYTTVEKATAAWKTNVVQLDSPPTPVPLDGVNDAMLLDYQRFREDVADEWTRRQVAAIKQADPDALVTAGLIQWSVPVVLPRLQHYSGFRPERQARYLDFMEIHFYPLENGAYEYRGAEDETRNLAYLECVVREVARCGKPVVVAEFGWYGGGTPTFDKGKHPAATEEQQARWCRNLVETTRGMAVGWLNWGFYDQPEATDVSQLTGLFTADGKEKAWGREFRRLSGAFAKEPPAARATGPRPKLDWDTCLTSMKALNAFRERYTEAFRTKQER